MTLRYKLGVVLCLLVGILISLATWWAQGWLMDRTDKPPTPPRASSAPAPSTPAASPDPTARPEP